MFVFRFIERVVRLFFVLDDRGVRGENVIRFNCRLAILDLRVGVGGLARVQFVASRVGVIIATRFCLALRNVVLLSAFDVLLTFHFTVPRVLRQVNWINVAVRVTTRVLVGLETLFHVVVRLLIRLLFQNVVVVSGVSRRSFSYLEVGRDRRNLRLFLNFFRVLSTHLIFLLSVTFGVFFIVTTRDDPVEDVITGNS